MTELQELEPSRRLTTVEGSKPEKASDLVRGSYLILGKAAWV